MVLFVILPHRRPLTLGKLAPVAFVNYPMQASGSE